MSSNAPLMSPKDLSENLSKHIVVDVRRPDEWFGELGHIEGAKLVTLGEDLTDFIKNSRKDDSFVFVCRSGKRSDAAALEATAAGLEFSYNMDGGMILWNEKSLPTIKPQL